MVKIHDATQCIRDMSSGLRKEKMDKTTLRECRHNLEYIEEAVEDDEDSKRKRQPKKNLSRDQRMKMRNTRAEQ